MAMLQNEELNATALEMYLIQDAKIQNEGGKVLYFDGYIQVSGNPVVETRKEVFPEGSIYISTGQTLGDLAMFLLEAKSADSTFN